MIIPKTQSDHHITFPVAFHLHFTVLKFNVTHFPTKEEEQQQRERNAIISLQNPLIKPPYFVNQINQQKKTYNTNNYRKFLLLCLRSLSKVPVSISQK